MYPIVTENDKVKMTEQYFTMPDGVGLYTRIVVPKHLQKCPIVFIRTPYADSHNGQPHNIGEYDSNPFIQNGYAVVLQHCRGRGDSEGICLPHSEREDGLNSLALIRQLDIYDNEIYVCGGSYLAMVHLCYLHPTPPDIKAAVITIQCDRMYLRNYRNGCCFNYCNVNWWLSMLKRQFPQQNTTNAIRRPYKDIMKRILGQEYMPFTSLLLNDKYTDFWKNDPRTYVADDLQIPVLFAEGWYDYYVEGYFSMWQRLPEATREKSALLIGPWGHATAVSQKAEYPLPSGNIPADWEVQWFNYVRTGKPYPYAKTGLVNYYSIGKDSWQAAAYPSRVTDLLRLYFGEQGTLTEAPTDTDASISYTYDPEVPVDCYRSGNIFKAAEVGSAEGVTSFQSAEFAEDTDFFGRLRWHMNVSSDCEDTAFFIRFYLVEDGIAYNLTETITSLTHLNENYRPGDTITIIDLSTPPMAFTIKKGCALRVDISSHGGIYVPHANVKGHWAEVTETKVATNALYLRDAFLELPIA